MKLTGTRARTIAALMLLATLPLAAEDDIFKAEATASYYGDEFNGRPTSSGEIFDMNAMTAAHKSLPFGTMLEITNLDTGKIAVVRVNDRGPFVADREIDVSKAAAKQLDMLGSGTARVSIKFAANDESDGTAQAARAAAKAAAQAETAALTPSAAVKDQNAESTTPGAPQIAKDISLARAPSGAQWRIQLGSFASEQNAYRLVSRLRDDGFSPAYEKTGNLTRVVLVGIADADLSATQSRLDGAGYARYLVRRESW